MGKIDFSAMRAAAERAKAAGLIAAPPPTPALLEDEITVEDVAVGSRFDLVVLNQVFGLRLNRTMSPLRMVNAIVGRWKTMTAAERAEIPETVRQMVDGLAASITLSISEAGQVRRRVSDFMVSVERDTATVRAANFAQFSRNLETSAGWPSLRRAFGEVVWEADKVTLSGGMMAAIYAASGGTEAPVRLSAILRAVMANPVSRRNMAGDLMSGL